MTSDRSAAVRVLSRALDQTADVLALVHEGDLGRPTPCRDWTVGQLVDHLVADPAHFLQAMRGERPDWTSAPPEVLEGWVETFRERADDLLHAWHQLGEGDAPADPDWQTAEFAVHGWDLVRALGKDGFALDEEVGRRGLAFVHANLRDEIRGEAFGPIQPAPDDAGVYEQLAAYSGRRLV